ncbi:MAG: hypothetical protein J0H68_01940 [Sphingobacteriia bacterium]|nr:hypothetical protein [Sphingobacteriia bacterium]
MIIQFLTFAASSATGLYIYNNTDAKKNIQSKDESNHLFKTALYTFMGATLAGVATLGTLMGLQLLFVSLPASLFMGSIGKMVGPVVALSSFGDWLGGKVDKNKSSSQHHHFFDDSVVEAEPPKSNNWWRKTLGLTFGLVGVAIGGYLTYKAGGKDGGITKLYENLTSTAKNFRLHNHPHHHHHHSR